MSSYEEGHGLWAVRERVDDVGLQIRQLLVRKRHRRKLRPLGELLAEKVDVAQLELGREAAAKRCHRGIVITTDALPGLLGRRHTGLQRT